jgi:ArsR family metal-binding transcriptional regulator
MRYAKNKMFGVALYFTKSIEIAKAYGNVIYTVHHQGPTVTKIRYDGKEEAATKFLLYELNDHLEDRLENPVRKTHQCLAVYEESEIRILDVYDSISAQYIGHVEV